VVTHCFLKVTQLRDALHASDSDTSFDVQLAQDSSYVRSRVLIGSSIRAVRTQVERGESLFISFDAAHMQGRYSAGGLLFSVVTVDPDNHILPLLVGHAYGETGDNWYYMLEGFRECEALWNDVQSGFTLMSDRGSGSIAATSRLPDPERRNVTHCSFHIAENIRHRFGKDAAGNVTVIAASMTEAQFYYRMSQLAVHHPGAYAMVSKIHPSMWVAAFVPQCARGRRTSQVH
jgi:hypothetical protein